jgi:hypothetical protein
MLACHFSIRCLQFPIRDSRLCDMNMGLTNQSSSTQTSQSGSASRNAYPADSQHCAPPSSISSVISLKFIFPRLSHELTYVYCSLLKDFVLLLSHVFCCNILQSRGRDAFRSSQSNTRCLLKRMETISWLNGCSRPGLLNPF